MPWNTAWIARLAAYCGISGGFDGFAAAVMLLRKQLNVPHTLAAFLKNIEIDDERKGLIADMAFVDQTAGGNPVELTREAALELLEDSLIGNI